MGTGDPAKPHPSAIRPEGRPRPLLRVALVVGLIGLGIWIWDATKYRFFPKRFGVVTAGRIYRSGQIHAALVEKVLRRHGIQVILSLVGPVPDDPDQAAERAAVETLGIDYHCYPLQGDGTGDPNLYVEALVALVEARDQGRPVLVHCAAGSQRTGVAIALYRLLLEGRDPKAVYRELRHYGWRDKRGHALLPYLNAQIGPIAEQLVARGLLAHVPDPLPQVRGRHPAAGPEP